MMSTQSREENGVIQSSIALLQERFRQLQRVKEMRENKDLLRMFSDYKNTSTNVSSNNIPSPTKYDTNTSSPTGISLNSTSNINPSKQYNDYDDDELQIFIPPNYYNTNNINRKSSCYLSSSTSSTISSSKNNNHDYGHVNDVSLSLWPPMSYDINVEADDQIQRRGSFEDSVSKMNMLRSQATKEHVISKPSTCVSSAYKLEDSHFSDVDTTLHL